MTLIRSGWCESVKIKFLSVRLTIRSEVRGVTLSVHEHARVHVSVCGVEGVYSAFRTIVGVKHYRFNCL